MSDQPNSSIGGLMYLPGETILSITHDNRLPLDEILADVRGGTEFMAGDFTISATDAKRAVTFRVLDKSRDTVSFADDSQFNTLVRAVLTGTRGGAESQTDTINKIIDINAKAMRNGGTRGGQSYQMFASPNWLIGGQPYVPIGGGGPSVPPKEQPFNSATFQWNLPPALLALDPDGTAATPVNVFVFDTVPPRDRLDALIANASNPMHALLTNFKQKLTIHDASSFDTELPPALPADNNCDNDFYRLKLKEEFQDPPDVQCKKLDKEDYSDHGVFIAMLIHLLAPNANIHLLEVLNDACVGSMRNLTQGLAKMREMIAATPDIPSVVNMSLLFCTPAEAILQAALEELGFWFNTDLGAGLDQANRADDSELIQRVVAFIMRSLNAIGLASEIYQDVGKPKVHFLAAAGNEGGKHTRYPANAAGVWGIGAIGKKPTQGGTAIRAAYSNVPDITTQEAMWAWGGGDAKGDTPILGLCTKSASGVAEWSGTSFATGIASGVLARALGCGKDEQFVRTQCKITDLDGSPVIDAFQGSQRK